jgi:transcription termination factor Rho
VTDIQDQLDVLPRSTGEPETAESPAQQRARRRSGSLTSMLLPELQALASSLGVNSAKMRKSDLIAAIHGVRGANAPTTAAPVTPPSPDESAGGPAASAEATAEPGGGAAVRTARPPRSRRGTARAAAHYQSSAEASVEPSSPAPIIASEADSAGEADSAPEPERSAVEPNPQAAPARTEGFQRGAGTDRTRTRDGNQNRDNQNRDNPNREGSQSREYQSRDNQNRDNQNRDRGPVSQRNTNDNQRDGQRYNNDSQRYNSGDGDSDDDEFGSTSRRGRRYRERNRGRGRDRFDTTSTPRNEPEPTIAEDDVLIPVAGILDSVEDKNTWFVRVNGYFAGPDDVYVSNSLVRRYGLRRGDAVVGAIRQLREGERKEKFNPLARLDTVNGLEPEKMRNRVEFTKLTPLYPQERLRLETEPHILTTRVIDLVMPIGKGQRALIVSPPKAGKTSVLQAIANAIATNNPECHLMVVLVDERPEEVTDMQRSVKGEVIASTFDRRPQDHTQIAELSIERAKRLVEMGHDVVVLMDSITRLGRAYNLAAPASGRILSGGVDSTALYPPKRFLGAARNIEHGGSLTILATALVETGSAMDTVIFEEFKGTGNAELKLDRKIADKRTFPAIDVDQSSTRKEEILLPPDELAVIIKLRRVLHSLDQQPAIDLLLDRLKKNRTNLEFLMQIAKTAPGGDDR